MHNATHTMHNNNFSSLAFVSNQTINKVQCEANQLQVCVPVSEAVMACWQSKKSNKKLSETIASDIQLHKITDHDYGCV